MTDEELIKRLRHGEGWPITAADRIEELVKERDEARIAINQIGEAMGVLGIVQCLDDIVAEAKKRFAKLTKAVAVLRFYTHDYVLSGSKARAVLAELEGK